MPELRLREGIPRRITQISSSASQYGESVYALASDGTVWWLPASGWAEGWTRLPALPHIEPEEPA